MTRVTPQIGRARRLVAGLFAASLGLAAVSIVLVLRLLLF